MRLPAILLISAVALAQPKLTETARLPFSADSFAGADPYGNIYAVRNNTLTKTGDGKSVAFKKLSLGQLTRVDLTNPLLILLFYETFNAVVLVDNQLNEVRTIDFSRLENPLVVHAVGMAAQNKLWVYDSVTQQLGLLDYDTGNYKTIGTPLTTAPGVYGSSFNRFQWIDANGEHFICDLFGKISTLGSMPFLDRTVFDDNGNAIGNLDGKLILAESATGKYTYLLALPEIRGLSWHGQHVVVATPTEIVFYTLSY